jgi:hypothetical protein
MQYSVIQRTHMGNPVEKPRKPLPLCGFPAEY